MKLRILVLVGILAISLPMVLFAQSTTSTSTTSSVVSGCMTISSGDTEVQTLTKQLTCVFNLTESLSVKLKNLEEKLNTLEIKKDITVDNVPVVKKCSNGAIDYPACVIIKDSTIDTEIIDVKVKKCSNGAIDYPACVIIKDSTIDTEIIDVKVKKCSNGATNYPTCTTKVAVDVCKSTIAETKVIQTFLKAEGSFTYPTATGNYGNITTDAVKKFQTKEGITSTGLIDGDTLQKMKVLAPSIAPSISKSVEILCPTLPIISINTKPLTDNNGDTDAKSITNKDKPSARKFTIAETKVIQTFLKAEGSFTYPTATGNYGNITTDAVKKFQTKEGITSTGLIDGDTLQKMKVLAPSIAPSISKSVETLRPILPIISINTKPPTADNGDTDAKPITNKDKLSVCKSTIAETKVIQTFLKAEGSFTYPTATGNYGNITTDAVKKFQTKEGITSTGLIDGDTLQKMKVLAPSIAPSISKSVEILCPTLPIISINTKPPTADNGDVGIPVSN